MDEESSAIRTQTTDDRLQLGTSRHQFMAVLRILCGRLVQRLQLHLPTGNSIIIITPDSSTSQFPEL